MDGLGQGQLRHRDVEQRAGRGVVEDKPGFKVTHFHPDRIQAKGLPEEFISFAEKEMQRINLAYEQIRKSRGMR